ncbi:MAG: ABC transporter permease, partial [Bryobacterales bacterium]|nr:ABC transporter permease [Bryobacterales bacterium]
MNSLWQDLRYGLRQWKSSPGFAAVAVVSLGLGIGANSAIFQLVDAVRLRTLPVERPSELAYIDFAQGSRRSGWFSTRSARLTHVQWEELNKRQQAFSGLAAWSASRFNLAEGGEARYAEGMFVNGDFFRVLGVRAERGRLLTPEDDRGDCFYGAVISEAFWQREYGGDAGVLGRKITLEGKPFEVIGVTAPAFFGVEVGRRYDVAIPLCADKALDPRGKGRKDIRHAWWLSAMGRLKPGWTVAKAKSHLEALSLGLMEATIPEEYKSGTVEQYRKNKLEATAGETGVSQLRRQYEQPLWLLLATTGLVLLIACANVANLLLARASVREREVAVRLAMGASRQRLVRQLFLESLLLAAGGALLGLVLAQALSRTLVSYLSTVNNPVFVNVGWDWRVLGFTSAVAFGTCLLFGLMPAWRATQVAPASAMRTGGRGSTSGRDRNTLRRVLVSTQIALSMVLLVGALLFSGSLRRLLNTDAGFASDALLAVTVDWRQGPQDNRERLLATFRDVKEKLAAIPGVAGAAEVSIVPLSGSGWNNNVGPDNTTAAASGKESFFNRVGPGYFRTMGTAVLAGREIDDRDTLGSAKVAVVNEVFAAKYFGGA